MPPRPTSPHRALLALLLLIVLSSISPAPVPAAPAALPTPLPAALAATGTARSGSIFGNFIVYIGDFTLPGRIDMYSAPRGGTPVRLSSGLPDGEVAEYASAGDRVVFSWFSDGRYALYSAPLAGGLPLRLNPEYTNPDTGRALNFAVAGSRVVFAVTQERREVGVLYSVPATGGVPTRLSVALPDPGPGLAWSVRSVYTSDDNSTVAYTLALSGNTQLIYTVPTTGGPSTLINAEGESLQGNLKSIALTPNGSRVVYLTVVILSGGGSGLKLMSVAANGGDRQELDSAAQISFQITGDGARVVYFRSDDAFSQTGELHSVPIGGGAPAQLSASATMEFVSEPSGATVFFTPIGGGLQRVPAAGGAAQIVLAQGFATLGTLRFSAAGYAVFTASDGPNPARLYSYPLAGGTALPINDPAVSALFLGDFRLTGERVVYFAIAAGGEPPQLFSVPVLGGASVKLSGAYEGGEDFINALSTSDSELLYGVGTRVIGQPLPLTRLLLVPVDGSSSPSLVNRAATDPELFKLHLPLLRK